MARLCELFRLVPLGLYTTPILLMRIYKSFYGPTVCRIVRQRLDLNRKSNCTKKKTRNNWLCEYILPADVGNTICNNTPDIFVGIVSVYDFITGGVLFFLVCLEAFKASWNSFCKFLNIWEPESEKNIS